MTDAQPAPISILHVAQPVDHGVARCVAAAAADQVGRGWRVTVACPPEGWLASAIRDGGAAHHAWPAQRAPHRGVAREWRSLHTCISEVAPDVVHLHSAKAGLIGRLVMRGRRPTIYQPHAWSFLALGGGPRKAAEAWERLAARWTDTIICCSSDEERLGEDRGVVARTVVVPNAVDLDRFRPADGEERRALRAAAGLSIDVPVAVCVGRLSRQKGQDRLVSSWPAVREVVDGATLVLVGDGPDRDELAAAAGDGVLLVGEQSDVRSWLVLSDLAVLPSRYEGMALGVVEAMACGRSVVATDVDGMREALGSDADAAGAVVGGDEPAALVAAVAERLANPALAAAEGERGRSRAEARHGLEAWAAALAEVAKATAERQ